MNQINLNQTELLLWMANLSKRWYEYKNDGNDIWGDDET